MKAKLIAEALGGRRVGPSWMAHCPAHRDRTPSLSIRETDDGRVLVHCFAGCSQHDVINALTGLGLWHPSLNHPSQRSWDTGSDHVTKLDRDRAEKTEAALRIWNSASPVDGTLAADYLASRGLTLPPPSAIRFHPGLKHSSGSTWPCMIALVTDGVVARRARFTALFSHSTEAAKRPSIPQE